MDKVLDTKCAHFMARPRQNKLTIEPVYITDPTGLKTGGVATYRLFGFINGQKIRRRDSDLTLLEKERDALLVEVAQRQSMEQPKEVWTFATEAQVRMLEGFLREFPQLPRPIGEYLRAGVAAIGDGSRVKIADARTTWKNHMESSLVKITGKVSRNNLNLLDDFTAFSKVTFLDEITPEHCRLFLERPIPGKANRKIAKTQTRLSHALRIQSFLNFCIKARLLKKMPLEVDLDQLAKIARQERERARILRPAQIEALLDATIEICPALLPRILLGTFCFIRDAEIGRLTPEDVYLDNKRPMIRLTGQKVGSSAARGVDIPANILPLLRQCIDFGLWEKDKAPASSMSFFRRVREKAGLIKLSQPDGHGFQRVLNEGNHWQGHILRHTGISYHFNMHNDITDTTRQAGNCPETAFNHYISLPHDGEAEAFYKITRVLKKGIAQETAQAVA